MALTQRSPEGCRGLADEKTLAEVDRCILTEGYLSIEEVRELLSLSCADGRSGDEPACIDPELLFTIDLRTNYDIYVVEDEVYTLAGLAERFPLLEGHDPRGLFSRQEVGAFRVDEPGDYEYAARDAEDPDEFLLVSDQIRGAMGADTSSARRPERVALTKIYIGRERWSDFMFARKMARVVSQFGGVSPGGSGLLGFAGNRPGLLGCADEEPCDVEPRADESGGVEQRATVPCVVELHAEESGERAEIAATWSMTTVLQKLGELVSLGHQLLEKCEGAADTQSAALSRLEARAARLQEREAQLRAREGRILDLIAGGDFP